MTLWSNGGKQRKEPKRSISRKPKVTKIEGSILNDLKDTPLKPKKAITGMSPRLIITDLLTSISIHLNRRNGTTLLVDCVESLDTHLQDVQKEKSLSRTKARSLKPLFKGEKASSKKDRDPYNA